MRYPPNGSSSSRLTISNSSAVGIAAWPSIAALIAARSCGPRPISSTSPGVLSSSAAIRALAGQSPPARSAIASSGSQASQARSLRPSGSSGTASCSSSTALAAQASSSSRRAFASGSTNRNLSRSTVSPMRRRFMRRITALSCTVSGSRPVSIPASTFGQNTEKSRTSIFVPCPTTRVALAPLRLPAFSTARSGSVLSLLDPKIASISSNSRHGSSRSIFRNSAASVVLSVCHGWRTTSPSTSRPRVLPLCFSALTKTM